MKPDLDSDENKQEDLNRAEQDYRDKFEFGDFEQRAAEPSATADSAAQSQRDSPTREDSYYSSSRTPSSSGEVRDSLQKAETGSTVPEGKTDEVQKLSASAGVEPTGANNHNIIYNQSSQSKSGWQRLKGKITKRTGIWATVALLVSGLSIGGFFSLLPFKAVSILESISDRVFGVSQNALEERGETLFEYYIKKHVLTKLGPNKCRSSIDRNCMAGDITANNPASRLYRGWKDARLETMLAEKHGLEFRYTQGGGISVTVNGEISSLSNSASNDNNNELRRVLRGKPETRRAVNEALAKQTKWRQVWERHKLGKFLERKYHLNRCIMACSERDKFSENRNLKKQARRAKLIERVVTPRSETAGIILSCVQNPSGCEGDSSERGPHGEKRTKIEKDAYDKLASYRNRFNEKKAAALLRDADDISKNGYAEHLAKRFLGDTIGKLTTKGVPVIGWVDLGINIADLARNAPDIIKAARYSAYAAQGASMYMMYRTNADEIKAGQVDPEVVSSFAEGFGTSEDSQGMGISPAYNALFSQNTSQSSGVGSGVAYAQGTAEQYRCGPKGDGDPITPGDIACPEESFAASSLIQGASGATDFANSVYDLPFNVGRLQVDLWKTTVGKLLRVIDSGVGLITGPALDAAMGLLPQSVRDNVDEAVTSLQKWVVELFIGNPCDIDMSGARNTQCIIAGAVASNTENANNGMGGMELTREQVAQAVDKNEEQKRYAFEQKPLFDRFFDLNETKSFSSKLAREMPSNLNGLTHNVANYALNPLEPVSRLAFSRLSEPASASSRGETLYDVTSAFGVKSIGIPSGHPALTANPDTITDEGCEARNEEWFNGVKTDESTGYRYQTEVNECLLEEQAVGALGGLFTDEVLKEDEANLTGASSQSSGSTGSSLPSGNAQQLAQQILDSGKVTGDGQYISQIEAVANGDNSCNVNPTILGLIVALSAKHELYINSLNRYCTGVITASGTDSRHYREGGGHAIDFAIVDGVTSTGSTPNDLALFNEAATILPPGSGFGQSNCRSVPLNLPEGIDEFNDSCNHVHIQVPVQ